jgi:hypothetical protein
MGGLHPAATVDKSPLEARAIRYWTLRQAKDLGALYGMYSSELVLPRRRLQRVHVWKHGEYYTQLHHQLA